MLKIFNAGFFCLTLMLVHSVFADSLTDLGEVYTAESAPGKTETAPSAFHGLLGAGLFNFEKIIGDNNRKTAVLPIIIMTYQDWAYWSIGGGGVWLLQSEDRRLKLGVGLKVHRGYTEEDDTVYAGMNTRKRSLDGSVNALWKTDIVNSSLHYYHDIGKASNGDSATLKFSHAYELSQGLKLIPSVGAEWFSANEIDYYYGVTPAESTSLRPVYIGQTTVNYSAGLNTTYLADRTWLLMGGVHYARLGNGITDSPLVSRSNTLLVYFGTTWIF
jgi:outer membrane protein